MRILLICVPAPLSHPMEPGEFGIHTGKLQMGFGNSSQEFQEWREGAHTEGQTAQPRSRDIPENREWDTKIVDQAEIPSGVEQGFKEKLEIILDTKEKPLAPRQ